MANEVEQKENVAKEVGEAAAAGAAAGVADAMRNEINAERNQIGNSIASGGGAIKDGAINGLPGVSIGEKLGGKIGEQIAKEMPESMIKDIGNLKKWLVEKDGVQSLSTGDHLVKEGGKQTLFTPNGDKVVVNPDGSHEIKGNVERVTSKKGVTTVEFSDGGRVSFDKMGILSVERDNQMISFGRPGLIKCPPFFDPHVLKPLHGVPELKPEILWNGKR